MARGAAIVLLAVMGIGVFLAGLELMITAVALPAIIVDLADWQQLRTASWIVNGYLLVSIVTMPLAGRLSDRWGVRRLFLGALVVFVVGSVLAGRAQSLEELIAARLVQAFGGGALVPVATAAASHLFDGPARPRALGFIGALTFLGMAAGPFAGAWIMQALHPVSVLESLRLERDLAATLTDALGAPWRYVFYVNVPIGIAALAIGWAATAHWDTERRDGGLDLAGAAAFSLGLGLLLVGLTLAGAEPDPVIGLDASVLVATLLVAGLAAVLVALAAGARHAQPFVDLGWFRAPGFASAALVSLLTGYGFATAIIGGAVFVDRVLYGGPDLQRVALGSLAGATALGALASGFVLRAVGLRLTTVVGLGLSIAALARMAGWTPATDLAEVAIVLGAFGTGFGLTVTPRSTAAVEALGRAAFGVASSTVTVARMIGMAVGLAVLTAFGSTVIDELWSAIYATPDAYKAFVPAALRDRALEDGLVVQALESWASGEAARILVGIFLVAAGVMAVAVVPALALGRSRAGPASRAEPASLPT